MAAKKRAEAGGDYPELVQVRVPRGTKKRLVAISARHKLTPTAYHRQVLLLALEGDATTRKET